MLKRRLPRQTPADQEGAQQPSRATRQARVPEANRRAAGEGIFGLNDERLQAGSRRTDGQQARIHWPGGVAALGRRKAAASESAGRGAREAKRKRSRSEDESGDERARSQKKQDDAVDTAHRKRTSEHHPCVLPEVNLRLQGNSFLLGYVKQIKEGLCAVVLEAQPVIPSDHLLNEPSSVGGASVDAVHALDESTRSSSRSGVGCQHEQTYDQDVEAPRQDRADRLRHGRRHQPLQLTPSGQAVCQRGPSTSKAPGSRLPLEKDPGHRRGRDLCVSPKRIPLESDPGHRRGRDVPVSPRRTPPPATLQGGTFPVEGPSSDIMQYFEADAAEQLRHRALQSSAGRPASSAGDRFTRRSSRALALEDYPPTFTEDDLPVLHEVHRGLALEDYQPDIFVEDLPCRRFASRSPLRSAHALGSRWHGIGNLHSPIDFL